jgi:hypothetical protein
MALYPDKSVSKKLEDKTGHPNQFLPAFFAWQRMMTIRIQGYLKREQVTSFMKTT